MADPHVIPCYVYNNEKLVQKFHLDGTGDSINKMLDPVFDWMEKNPYEEKEDG